MASVLALSACGQSRLNPFNWFGGARSVPTTTSTAAETNPLLPQRRAAVSIFRTSREEVLAGLPIAVVDELLIERRPGGAIIRTTGIADSAGPYDVRLALDPGATDADTLAYSFLIKPGAGPARTGPDARKVTAAVFLTDNELAGIREIRMTGRENALVSRR